MSLNRLRELLKKNPATYCFEPQKSVTVFVMDTVSPFSSTTEMCVVFPSTSSPSAVPAAPAEAARAADWPLAIDEQVRAIAAALDERTLVDVRPGTTATEFAAQAARSAPDQGAELRQAAKTFDEVRYLDRPGSEAGYQQLVALDAQLQRIRPAQEAVVA